MSSVGIPHLTLEPSSTSRGRLTGVIYLLFFLTAILAQLLSSRNLVFAGTATNLVSIGFYLALGLLFYTTFKPVNRSISLLAALFNLGGCIVMTVGLFYPTLMPISPLWFFGPYCLLIGYLVLRSTFLPRILGLFMVLAGVGWLAFLIPAVALHLTIYIEALGIFAEAALMLWLIVKGVTSNAGTGKQLRPECRCQPAKQSTT
jgi:hypothetical protein